MKKTLLFLIIAAATQVNCFGAVSVDQSTSTEYIKNQGFSKDAAELVTVSKARSTGTEYYTPEEEAYRNSNKFVRFWKRFYAYTDPAAEDYSFYHHNTTPAPTYEDL